MVQSIEDYSLQNISNRINFRKSQTSILYIKFPVFLFQWKAMHENACKFLHESTKNCWSSSQDVNLGVFLRGKTILDFFLTECRNATFVRPARVHRKCHISMYFLRKAAASHFLPREKISRLLEKNTIIPDNIKIMYRCGLFGKTIFSESLKKISYFRVFFKKDHLSFSV